jgi:hypothetical protein
LGAFKIVPFAARLRVCGLEDGGLIAFARERGLSHSPGEAIRAVTPALQGAGSRQGQVVSGALAPGLNGQLFHLAAGDRTGDATGILTTVAETRAYVTAIACQDRALAGRRAPVKYSAERWEEVRLESSAFAERYRLLVIAGQDAGWTRELFSPASIAWLTDHAPAGFSFELNEGHLCILVPGRIQDAVGLAALCEAAAELAARIREEAREEGTDPDLFRAAEASRKLDAAVAEVEWRDPPASVAEAVAAYRSVASRKPRTMAIALVCAGLGMALGAGIGWLVGGAIGLVSGAVAGGGFGFQVGRLFATQNYLFEGTFAVDWVGINAFNREYARSRGLARQNKFAFHHENRDLPVPGFADSVQAGPVPGTNHNGLFVMLADSPELRASGRHTMGAADAQGRSLSYDVLIVELTRPSTHERIGDLELPPEFHVDAYGGNKVVVWRPIAGNMTRTSAGCDEFRGTAGRLIAALEGSVGTPR